MQKINLKDLQLKCSYLLDLIHIFMVQDAFLYVEDQ